MSTPTPRLRRAMPGLRTRFAVYLVVLHVVFAAAAVVFLREHRLWLIAIELFFMVSALVAWRLLRALFEPLNLLRASTSFLQERDFATRLQATGVPELEDLIDVYNHMAEELREERLRGEEQEGFLQKILAVSPLGVLTLDFESRVVFVNGAGEKLLEAPGSEILGQSLRELARPDGVPAVAAWSTSRRRFVGDLIALGIGESRVLSLDGRRRVRCVKSQLMDRGHPRQFLLLEELTEELHRTEKAAYDRLIRLMSHEVNNTTGAVTSLLQSCMSYRRQLSEQDREDFTHALDVASRRSTHMNEFMRRFADVIRLPAPRKRLVDVLELVDAMVRLVQQEASERRIDIRWERRDVVPQVALDTAQMEQVLLNILRNALEAVQQDGCITLRLLQEHGRTELQIEDDGPGLSPEVQEHLFTPFYTTKSGGQGIGLTLIREILEAHEFAYALEGDGDTPTRFTISLTVTPRSSSG